MSIRWVAVGLLGLIVCGILVVGPAPSAVWETIRANLDGWQAWAGNHPLPALVTFFGVYTLATALPLPVLTIMSLLAGSLFGRELGTAVASAAYTAGVTVAFLTARSLLSDPLRQRAGGWLGRFERGVERDGGYYLLALRLMPSVPFFLVNVLMALTPIRTRTYVLVSWLGVLPMTFLYANVGTELAAMESPSDLISLPVLASLVALALLPLVVRKLLRSWRGDHLQPSGAA